MSDKVTLKPMHLIIVAVLLGAAVYFMFISPKMPVLNGSENKSSLEQLDELGQFGIKRGDRVPDFSIKTIEGKQFSFSESASKKPVILYFFATWCISCIEDLNALKQIYPDHKDSIEFIAIDLDQEENLTAIDEFRKKYDYPWQFAEGDENLNLNLGILAASTKLAAAKGGVVVYKDFAVLGLEGWKTLLNELPKIVA